jgi:hypothetical protein
VHSLAQHYLDCGGALAEHHDVHGLTGFGHPHFDLFDVHGVIRSAACEIRPKRHSAAIFPPIAVACLILQTSANQAFAFFADRHSAGVRFIRYANLICFFRCMGSFAPLHLFTNPRFG